MNAKATSASLLCMLLLAGCGPEADCRSGIKQLRPRVEGAVNSGQYPEAREQISQAYTDLSQAEELAAAGDFAGCIEKVNSARVLLNKSQRS